MADSANQPERVIRPAWLATAVLAGLGLLLALWLRSGLIGSEQWPIRWLDVEGELDRTSASQIRAAVASPAGQGFFAVDLGEARDRVESLPWIARAEVSRHWPDALRIQVDEHRPVARWNDDRLFSDRGEVFRVNGSEGMQGLARLRGPEIMREQVLDRWLDMRRTLGRVGRDIVSLHVDDRGAWRVTLDDGITLVLGREKVEQRLERYIAVQPALSSRKRSIGTVDLRYTNGLAVRWAEPAQESESGDEQQHG
ncbi:MAG: FtsQ-type POTRA domain-containing protein [Gammaproteobacteria bacterium]|jgi:cell division protein FtsQ|nr:FtsQ-type POTRA domain-containing protein [Gammaproteobacteria bacterium]